MASCSKKRGATEKRHETDDSENEDVQRESVPREKIKKKKYLQKFRKSYSEDFEHIASSTKGAEYAFCSKCNLHLSIGHGGQHDIKKHVDSESHKSHPLCGPQITRFFAPDKSKVENASSTQSKLELDVIKAEATMNQSAVKPVRLHTGESIGCQVTRKRLCEGCQQVLHRMSRATEECLLQQLKALKPSPD